MSSGVSYLRTAAVLLLVASMGCRCVYPGRMPNGPKPCVPASVPRELSKTTLPDYIIEPPDVLAIEAISLIPKSPYKLRPLDVVSVSVGNVSPEANFSGQYIVQPNGTLQFLPPGGTGPLETTELAAVPAVGRTVEEVQQTLMTILARTYREPQVWVTLMQFGAQQQIIGDHLVSPDGKVNLGTYGRVRVVGMTIEEATAALEAHLSQYLEDPQISVDILGYNSKVFYVVMQGAGFGDQVTILPATGSETVLDAIGQIQGLSSNQSTRMWIARPGANACAGDQLLPIDWVSITQRADATTNYQLLPGDRLFVSEDKLVAVDTLLGKIIAPLERIMGFATLTNSTFSNLRNFGQQGQNGGNFNNF
jgi:polysaccharide export outer membrane protein